MRSGARITVSGDCLLTRRSLLMGSAAATVGLAPWGRGTAAQADPPRLRVLGAAPYLEPALTAAFREATGARIEVTPIGALEDVFLFLRAGGIGWFDLAIPPIGLVAPLFEAGLTAPIDATGLPNASTLFPRFRSHPLTFAGDRQVGVPLLWGSLPMAYAPDALEEPPAAWVDLQEERFSGRVVMVDDVLGHFWIWNRVFGAQDPTRVSRETLGQVTDFLAWLKQQAAVGFDATAYGGLKRLARGQGSLSTIGWQSAPLVPSEQERPLAIVHPAPGDASFCDCLALVNDAPNAELALAFIDYLIAPDTQARIMDRLGWGTVSEAAVPLLGEQALDLYDYGNLDAVFEISPIRGYPPLSDAGDEIATYLDWVTAWDRVRSIRMQH